MVRREQGARHGSTESSGAETVKDGVGGNGYNGDSFKNSLGDRLVYPFLEMPLGGQHTSIHLDFDFRVLRWHWERLVTVA